MLKRQNLSKAKILHLVLYYSAKTAVFVSSAVRIYPACFPLPHPSPPHPLPSTAVIWKGAAEALRNR